MQRRQVLLAAAGAGFLSLTGTARAAPRSDLIDDHWLGEGDQGPITHDRWQQWLDRYLVVSSDGITRVRYGDVSQEDRDLLRRYLDAMAAIDITAHTRDEQYAYWLNLYNAVTVDVILTDYPVSSIRDINDGLFSFGPWSRELIEVEGRALSLDDIEHGILRPVWRDPLIHYGVNCAAVSCPNLLLSAFRGSTVVAQLTAAGMAYVNDPRGAVIDDDGRLTVSSIYVWFQEDFGGDDAGVIDHLRTYAVEPLTSRLAEVSEIYDDRYDWSLNDATGVSVAEQSYTGSDTRNAGSATTEQPETTSGSGSGSASRAGSGTRTGSNDR